jgi:spermidine synthase
LKNGRLRLLEPAQSCKRELLRQLIEGSYDKPFVLDRGSLRSLQFDLTNIQSVMRRDDPYALHLAYTRKMMAFLLFNAEPRRILLLGLGGGSLAKLCYRHLPAARITVLENDRLVLALREEFQIPADNNRFRVLYADGVAYVARRTAPQDVILVDACDKTGIAPALDAPQLYWNLQRRLSATGVLVMNICGEPARVADHFARILGVFGSHVIALPMGADGNLIVLAFRSAPPQWDSPRLQDSARALEGRFGLALPGLARKMAREQSRS